MDHPLPDFSGEYKVCTIHKDIHTPQNWGIKVLSPIEEESYSPQLAKSPIITYRRSSAHNTDSPSRVSFRVSKRCVSGSIVYRGWRGVLFLIAPIEEVLCRFLIAPIEEVLCRFLIAPIEEVLCRFLIAPIEEVLCRHLPLRVKTCTIHLQSQERQCWLTPYIYSFFVVRESKCKVKNKVKNVSVG